MVGPRPWLFLVVTNAIIVFSSNFVSLGEAGGGKIELGRNSEYGPFRELRFLSTIWTRNEKLSLYAFKGEEFNIGVDGDVSCYVDKMIVAVGKQYYPPPKTQAAKVKVVTGGSNRDGVYEGVKVVTRVEDGVKVVTGEDGVEGVHEKPPVRKVRRKGRNKGRGAFEGSRRREVLGAIRRAKEKISVYANVEIVHGRYKAYMRSYAEGSVFDSVPEKDEDCGYENRYDVYVKLASGSKRKMDLGAELMDALERMEYVLLTYREDLLQDGNTNSLHVHFHLHYYLMTLQMDAHASPLPN